MTEVEQRPYLTLHEAAQRLKKSVDDCYRMVRTGELQYVRVGRSIRIPFYAVEGLLSMQRAPVIDGEVHQLHDEGQTGDARLDGADAPRAPAGQTPADQPAAGPDAGFGTSNGHTAAPVAGAGPYGAPYVAGDSGLDAANGHVSTPVETDAQHAPPASDQPPAQPPAQPSYQATFAQSQAKPPVPPSAQPPAQPANVTIKPPESPSAQVPVVIETGQRGTFARILTPFKRAYRSAREVRVPVPFQSRETAIVVVSDSNLRAIVVHSNRVRFWATVGLKEGVVRDGAIVDAAGFTSALAALEAKLAGPRMAGRPLGIVVSGRSLVIGRFQADLPDGPTSREAMRRLVCDKLSVRFEDMTVDYHIEGGERRKRARKPKEGTVAEPQASREIFGIAALRSVLDSVLTQVITAKSRVTIAQPKAVSLVAAVGVPAGIVVDLEPTGIAVIIVRGGLPDVVRDVTIAPGLKPPQVAQILAGQVNRSVGYYNARYPEEHVAQDTPIFVTGEGAVDPQAIDLALATLPYRRQAVANPFEAPENFPAGAYAAALGAAQQSLIRHSRGSETAQQPALDFLPEEFRPRPLPIKKLAAATVAAVLVAGLVPTYQAVADMSGAVAALESTVGRLDPQVRQRTLQLRQVATLQEQLKTTSAAVEKLVAAEEAIKGTDQAFAEALLRIHSAVPAGVNLGEVDDDGVLVEIAASAVDPEDLFAFVRALSGTEGFSDVRIKSIALDQSGVKATIKVSRDAAVLNGENLPADGEAGAEGAGAAAGGS